ncbi:TonB-dependent receptor domain-containing protein [Neisseria bacilliformis]|uniref:TonB-dependent receptor domain-containing protein n=1 Tax=Neisseria bacilliformis TaxID=267212 RepID=UPI0028EFABD0|nr:TonB-dependent receptor [Neisseria bacilliformis]
MFDETVQNPAGIHGSYFKYLIGRHAIEAHDDHGITDSGPYDFRYITEKNEEPRKPYDEELIRKELDPNSPENWPTPEHVRAHAWSPMLSVSYDLTDNGRLHLRWAQAARFPSIYEATTVNSSWTDAYDQAFDLKPERSTNWEIGYTYHFAPPPLQKTARRRHPPHLLQQHHQKRHRTLPRAQPATIRPPHHTRLGAAKPH